VVPKPHRKVDAMAMINANGNAVGRHVAGPRVRYSNEDLLNATMRSQEYDDILAETRQANMTDDATNQLLLLLIQNMRLSDGTVEFKQQHVTALFKQCGLSARDAKMKICTALDAAVQGHDNPHDNNFLRRSPNSTNLDATHLSGDIYIKRDGLTEVLTGGQDAVSRRIRTFIPLILQVVEAQHDRALRYQAKHKEEEVERLASSRALNHTIREVVPSMTVMAARGRVARFNQIEYTALGVVDRNVAGFESASRALQSVAPQEQLARRRAGKWGGISDNLTTVGKDALRWMNSAADRDLQRRQEDIMALPTDQMKKRMLTNVLNERATRLKRLNVFHEDPAMVGVEDAAVDPRAQANYYLNQRNEMDNFE